MMFINNYCTGFMFQEVMVCVTCSPSILSLIIFNFLLVFKISQKFVEFYVYRFLIKKFIYKFQQNELYLENKKEIKNYERQYCRL